MNLKAKIPLKPQDLTDVNNNLSDSNAPDTIATDRVTKGAVK